MVRIDLLNQASAMAYTTLFALVPFLAALFTVISLVSSYFSSTAEVVQYIEQFILTHLAQESGHEVMAFLRNFIRSMDLTTLGLASVGSVLLTLLLLLRQIEVVFNQIWQVTRERNIFTRLLKFISIVGLAALLFSLTWTLGSGLAEISALFRDTLNQATTAGSGFSATVSLLVLWAFFILLFKVVPNTHVPLASACVGGGISTLLFFAARWGYSWYLGNFLFYKTIYGALAAVPIFLLWLYICWVIVLLGALITRQALSSKKPSI
jgi:membrane protein